MHCAAIMTANPPTLRDTDSIAAAAKKLLGQRHLSLPVVDAEGRYLGMFGADDLLSVVVPRVAIAGNIASNLRFVGDDTKGLAKRFRDANQQPVGAVANQHAIVLAPDTPQIEAFRIFCRDRASLPVVDPKTGKLAGLLSYWDVMDAITSAA